MERRISTRIHWQARMHTQLTMADRRNMPAYETRVAVELRTLKPHIWQQQRQAAELKQQASSENRHVTKLAMLYQITKWAADFQSSA